MADHRAEQIMDAVVTTVTGLTTTGSNVYRGRATDIPDTVDNALQVYMGPDDPLDDSGWPDIYSNLAVYVDLHARTNSTQIDQQLNQIRKEVTIALMADMTLGLDFVQDLQEGPVAEPDIDAVGAKISAMMRTSWIVKYNRNRMDPST